MVAALAAKSLCLGKLPLPWDSNRKGAEGDKLRKVPSPLIQSEAKGSVVPPGKAPQ